MSALDTFIREVASVARASDDEHQVAQRVAELLSALLAGGYRPPAELTRTSTDRHVTYPLYVAPDDSLSVACVVWAPGQRTPVHSHETWGVAGIVSGVEREVRYLKPRDDQVRAPLTPAGVNDWTRGQVTVCCTTDDDVHAVTAIGEEPTIGIHVYGGNIGIIRRRSYDPATGAVEWFASGWDTPSATSVG